MGRVIQTESTGKIRSRLMRTCAELLRHLSQKQALDDNAKDMAAFLALCLREIEAGIDESAAVWEKRDYWIKAEKLRQRWDWVGLYAGKIERALRDEKWTSLPETMTKLFPYFADVKVTRFTRSEDLWAGAYRKFLDMGG
ncbi:MAG: hypothetical protein JW910_12195 [Anaerolineae bacterium]|nr:hypothetical protein [Anaerolineae bacterium]